MGVLRMYLKENSRELYESLERSWETAFDTWLPAVPPNLDTYNSFPHLRNLEVYADKIAVALKKYRRVKGEFLSPLETYILLASILFHDIGKAKGGKDHGKSSGEIIRSTWGLLGIPNEELAYSISRICIFHDYDPKDAAEKITDLTSSVVDPFGNIRERRIAVLLMLVDHIDGSFIRIVPDFIRNAEDKEILGAFRKKIRGIDVDIEGGMVKVVLGEDVWSSGKDGREDNVCYKVNEEICIDKLYVNEKIKGKIREIYEKEQNFLIYKKDSKPHYFLERFNQVEIEEKSKDLLDRLFRDNNLFYILGLKKKDKNLIQLIDLFVILKIFHINKYLPEETTIEKTKLRFAAISKQTGNSTPEYDPKEDLSRFNNLLQNSIINNTDKKTTNNEIKLGLITLVDEIKQIINNIDNLKDTVQLPDESLLATLLGNTLENVKALQPIKSTLASIGLPIRGWLLEYKDHLYNYLGNETFEPIFTKEYLIHASRCMWDLSTRIFGHGELTYETLAAEMREPDIGKVRRAVRRIAIVPMPPDKEEKNTGTEQPDEEKNKSTDTLPIWFSDTGWKWNLNRKEGDDKCICMNLAILEDKIGQLEEPGDKHAG